MESRKRPRQSEEKNNGKSIIQTPHTLRLLKLLSDGTEDHAKLAASQLEITASTSTPLVLWDLLGRLAAFLISSEEWKCRQHTSWAMEAVAQYLPHCNQVQFMQQKLETDDGKATTKYMWLTVKDLTTQLAQVLKHGRLLYAEPSSSINDDSDELNEEFESGKERIQRQRRLLVRRLGLGGIMSATRSCAEDLLPQDITTSDLESTVRKKVKKSPSSEPINIRALLVLEWQQTNSHDSDHAHPQHLLATEMLFRMFDAHWQVRHGALLGISSLLKSWKKISQGHTAKTSLGDLGAWPTDILAKSLCVLALDRFADYGSADKSFAPVQHMAAQVVALLFEWSPVSVKEEVCQVIQQLLSNQDTWEIRQGGWMAVQFLIAITGDYLQEWVSSGIVALLDGSPDVVAVVAKILTLAIKRGQIDQVQTIDFESLSKNLSTAMSRHAESSVSACAVPLINLMTCVIMKRDHKECYLDWCNSIFSRLQRFLAFESSAVQLASLHAISQISPIILAKSDNNSQVNITSTAVNKLILQVYELYFDNYHHVSDSKVLERLKKARDKAWNALIIHHSSFYSSKTFMMDLFLRLVGICYQQKETDVDASADVDADTTTIAIRQITPAPALEQIPNACRALAKLITLVPLRNKSQQTSTSRSLISFVSTTILALLQSPWLLHCDTACLLFRFLHEEQQLSQNQLNCFLELFRNCHAVFLQRLMDGSQLQLPSLNIDTDLDGNKKAETRMKNLYRQVLVSTLKKSFDASPSSLLQNLELVTASMAPSVALAATGTMSVARLRLVSLLAGALVHAPSTHWPAKLTPLIRPIMTSIQSETCPTRLEWTRSSMIHLLQVLGTKEKEAFVNSLKIRDKVLGNVCKLIEVVETPITVVPSEDTAKRVVQALVSNLDPESTLRSLPTLWEKIAPLTSKKSEPEQLDLALKYIILVGGSMTAGSAVAEHLVSNVLPSLLRIAVTSTDSTFRSTAKTGIERFATTEPKMTLAQALPLLSQYLETTETSTEYDALRVGACNLTQIIVEKVDMNVLCPFVLYLLPKAMSLMTNPLVECARSASQLFANLVRVAPLVRYSNDSALQNDNHSNSVMRHLIHGQPLPPCVLPLSIQSELDASNITLRPYQVEGISWLHFLQTVQLHGALCDDMGLGKTLQALVAVALSHHSHPNAKSLVVCPSSVVGHWIAEIKRFFPTILKPIAFMGNNGQRAELWEKYFPSSNLVVVSYSILRSTIHKLSSQPWRTCILDEGHLLKNPQTATARAARQLRAHHRLILTGTPVQNCVDELWATLDFCLPHFLGSLRDFRHNYAIPIAKGHSPSASADAIHTRLEKLKQLHQQALPFLLRRTKEQVLRELPPKIITDLPCRLTDEQMRLYQSICQSSDVEKSLSKLRCQNENEHEKNPKLGSDVLKSLMQLRLLCTHPLLVVKGNSSTEVTTIQWKRSGKLQALKDLLQTANIAFDEATAADNDSSIFYVETNEEEKTDAYASTIRDESAVPLGKRTQILEKNIPTKCLIFGQFVQSLDIVEKYLLKAHMPSLEYLRLDGRVPVAQRSSIVEKFNTSTNIRALLLTTRVGSLGLNLTGASVVILLEHDYNPFNDLQAMDRAHRLGQKAKAVQVFRLVTENTLEEDIMKLQQRKMQMSNAIVNANNSTLFSMGTDRLLDIFTVPKKDVSLPTSDDLDELVEQEYQSLSVENFLQDLAQGEAASN